MALVPEFISLLRDIRDNKYPGIVDMTNQVLTWTEENRVLHNNVLTLKSEIIIIKGDTQKIHDDTVIYVDKRKSEIDQIKVDTTLLFDQTSAVYVLTEQARDAAKAFRDETESIKILVEAMTEGLGFTLDANGHLIVTIPATSNITRMWFDTNGHLMVELA